MKRAALTGAEAQRNEPSSLAGVRLARHLQEYPPGHPHYTPTVDERIALLRAATLEDAVACYRGLFGATGADFVAVGDFEPDALTRAVDELFGSWKTPHPFARVPSRYFERPASRTPWSRRTRRTPRCAPASTCACATTIPTSRRWCSPTTCSAARSTARVPARVREKEGLSYSTYTSFSVERARRVGRVPRRLDLRAAEPLARRARDPRGAGARGARRLQRRGGRGRQALGARGAAPRALAGPRARGPARPLPLRQAHLRLGHRVRSAHRRPHARSRSTPRCGGTSIRSGCRSWWPET